MRTGSRPVPSKARALHGPKTLLSQLPHLLPDHVGRHDRSLPSRKATPQKGIQPKLEWSAPPAANAHHSGGLLMCAVGDRPFGLC